MERFDDPVLLSKEFKHDQPYEWTVQHKKTPKRSFSDTNKNNNLRFVSSYIRRIFTDVFLPQDFPDSVHGDYIPYQIWDTVQAFASTILGTLATYSIMLEVGVGDAAATPLAASITMILKDSTGMISRIVFAWWNGPGLDAQCKQWRLFADVLNDLAMGIELCLPYFSSYSIVALCVSSAMKSLVGVAGGATRAAITQHQALNNNLADVSAKDGSQETCVNLIASFVGVVVLSYYKNSTFRILYYAILVAVHIYANYSAVRSLCFDTLNEKRLSLVIDGYLTTSVIPRAKQVNQRESIVGLFRSPWKDLCGFDISIGGSLDKFVESLKLDRERASKWAKILENHRRRYAKYFDDNFHTDSNEDPTEPPDLFVSDSKTLTIHVAVEECADPSRIVDTYFHAFLYAIYLNIDMNLRPDIIAKAKRCGGPLSVFYENIKRLGQVGSNYSDVDDIIDSERSKWSKLLDGSEWTRKGNLLPIGPYRSHWSPNKTG